MGFIKAALALMGWGFLCLMILNIPIYYKISSRLLLVLFPSFLLTNNVTLFADKPWLDLIIWLVIMILVIIPLTLLPRVKCAGFFMVTHISLYAVMRLIVDKIIPLFSKDFVKTGWTTAIVWGVPFLITLLAFTMIKEDLALPELRRRWVKVIDRIVASLITAFSILSPMLLYLFDLRFIPAMALLAVVVYFFDVLVFDWYVRTDFDPPPTEEEIEAMARREARREKRRNSLPAKVARGAAKGVVGVAKLSLGVLHVGGSIVVGAANLMGANMDNPIPSPGPILDSYAQMEKDYYDYILPQQEQEEYARIAKETEDAIKFYEENY